MRIYKKLILIIFFNLFYCNLLFGQITFNRQYDNYIDAVVSIIETNDGYIFPNNAYYPFTNKEFVIYKINKYGDTLWQKPYGQLGQYFQTVSIIQIEDSNYVVGAFYSDTTNRFCSYLMKINIFGDSLWFKRFLPDSAYNFFSSYVTRTNDMGYIIPGEREDTAQTNGDGFLTKVDSLGNLQWSHSYGGPKYDALSSAVELPDKGFLAVGWTRSFGFGNSTNRDVYLVRTDSLGNKLWQKTYGDTDSETGLGITSTIDGNFLIAGDKGPGTLDRSWLIKLDINGTLIWSQILNPLNESVIWWARETLYKEIISVGNISDFSNIDGGGIFLTDSSGSLKWYRRYTSGTSDALFRDVRQTTDGGFICAGFVFNGNANPFGNQDAWLVKVDSLGCDSAGCAIYATGVNELPSTTKNEQEIICYPNPAKDVLFVKLINYRQYDTFTITVINNLGQPVLKRKLLGTENALPVFINELPKGFYLVRCEAGDKYFSEKFIKE